MPLCSVLSLVKTDLQTAHSTGNVGKEGLNSLGIPTTVIRKRKMPKKPKNKPMYRPIDPQIEQGNCIFFLNFQIIFIQYPRTCQLSPLPSVLQKQTPGRDRGPNKQGSGGLSVSFCRTGALISTFMFLHHCSACQLKPSTSLEGLPSISTASLHT